MIFLMILRKSGFTKKKKVNQSTCAQGKKKYGNVSEMERLP